MSTNSTRHLNHSTLAPTYAYIIYVFLNGEGMSCQHVHFSEHQLRRGIKHVLEIISRQLNVKGIRLVTMDGVHIRRVCDLMSRGAYVLIPFGHSTFRNTWYFLPDNAIDTGENTEVWSKTSC